MSEIQEGLDTLLDLIYYIASGSPNFLTEKKHKKLEKVIDLLQAYLKIEDRKLVPKEKEIPRRLDELHPVSGVIHKAKIESWNACREEMILRRMKNRVSVEDVERIMSEKETEWKNFGRPINTAHFLTVVINEVIHTELEERER